MSFNALASVTKEISSLPEARSIVGIEYIEAGATSERIESRWGHALIRLIDADDNDFNDTVIGFAAEIDSDQSLMQKLWKGSFGAYRVTVETLPLSRFLNEYVNTEGRSLRRAIIPTTPQQTAQLLEFVRRFQRDPDFAGHYYFLGRNCAVLVQTALMSAGLDRYDQYVQKPVSVIDILQRAGSAPWPPAIIKDSKSIFEQIFKALGAKSATAAAKLTLAQVQARLPKVPDTVLRDYLVMTRARVPDALAQTLADELRRRQIKVDMSEIYRVQRVSLELYQACSDPSCFEKQWQMARTQWSPAVLHEHCAHLKKLEWTLFGEPMKYRLAEFGLCQKI